MIHLGIAISKFDFEHRSVIHLRGFGTLHLLQSEFGDSSRIAISKFDFEHSSVIYLHGFGTLCLLRSENDLMKYFREDLHRRLLSTDFKKQIDGIEMLHKALPSIEKEIVEILDILLRWFVLRFCESSTTCLLKVWYLINSECLDVHSAVNSGNGLDAIKFSFCVIQKKVLKFIPELFDTLRSKGYIMTESETAIFLPCLTEKSGHNIEKVREKMRKLIKQIIHAFSAAKTFPYVLEGLRSRNNRTRIECVDLVGFLIDNHGAEGCYCELGEKEDGTWYIHTTYRQ